MKKILLVLTVVMLIIGLLPTVAIAGSGFEDIGSPGGLTGGGGGPAAGGKVSYSEFTALKARIISWSQGGTKYTWKSAADSEALAKDIGSLHNTEYDRGSAGKGTDHWNVYLTYPNKNDPACVGVQDVIYKNFESREDGSNLSNLAKGGKVPSGSTYYAIMTNNFWAGATDRAAAGVSGGVLGAFRPVYNSTANRTVQKKQVNARINTLQSSSGWEYWLPSMGFAGENTGKVTSGFEGYVRGNMLGNRSFSNANYNGNPRIKFDMGTIFNNLENKEGRYAIYWYRLNAREEVMTGGTVYNFVSRPRVNVKVLKKDGTPANANWSLQFNGKTYVNTNASSSASKVFGSREGTAGGNAYLNKGESITSGYALPNSYDNKKYTLEVTTVGETFKEATVEIKYKDIKNVLSGTGSMTKWSGYSGKPTVAGSKVTLSSIPFAYIQNEADTSKPIGGYYEVVITLDGTGTTVIIDKDEDEDKAEIPSINVGSIIGPMNWYASNKPAEFKYNMPSTPITIPKAKHYTADPRANWRLETTAVRGYLWTPKDFDWVAKITSTFNGNVPYTTDAEAAAQAGKTLKPTWSAPNAGIPSTVPLFVENTNIFKSESAAIAGVKGGTTKLSGGVRLYGAVLFQTIEYWTVYWNEPILDAEGKITGYVERSSNLQEHLGYTWSNLSIKDSKIYDSTGTN